MAAWALMAVIIVMQTTYFSLEEFVRIVTLCWELPLWKFDMVSLESDGQALWVRGILGYALLCGLFSFSKQRTVFTFSLLLYWDL